MGSSTWNYVTIASSFHLALALAVQSHFTTTMSVSPFTSAHRFYVKSLYKRFLKNSLDWTIDRSIWRGKAVLIRAEFERNR